MASLLHSVGGIQHFKLVSSWVPAKSKIGKNLQHFMMVSTRVSTNWKLQNRFQFLAVTSILSEHYFEYTKVSSFVVTQYHFTALIYSPTFYFLKLATMVNPDALASEMWGKVAVRLENCLKMNFEGVQGTKYTKGSKQGP